MRLVILDLPVNPHRAATTMNEKIYLAFGQEQKGPFTRQEVEEKLASGEALPGTLAWIQGGRTEWIPLSELLNPPAIPPVLPSSSRPCRPYTPATNSSEHRPQRRSHRHPGIGRLLYFGYMMGAYVLLFLISLALAPLLRDYSALSIIPVGLYFVGAVVIVFHRLKNIGYNPWWCFLILVPCLNIAVAFPCLLAPPGYAFNKQLDLPAKIIGGVLIGLLVLGFIVALINSLSANT